MDERPGYVVAVRMAASEFFRRACSPVAKQEEALRQWRQEREYARHPMRCKILAKACAAK